MEMDEFLVQMQKESLSGTAEAKASLGTLMQTIDYSGYHQRRAGFDSAKYIIASGC